MSYNMMDYRKQYRIIVPVVTLLALICFFLPFVSRDNYSMSLFSLFLASLGSDGNTLAAATIENYSITRMIFTLPVILLVISIVLPLIAHKKITYRITDFALVITMICYFFIMVSTCKKVNATGLLTGKLYVKNFGFGFWIGAIILFIALAQSFKATKSSVVHIVLGVLAIIWVSPILWVIMTSFRGETGSYFTTFFPTKWTLSNYTRLFTETDIFNFPRWFMNTLIIACCSCILSSFYVLAVSFSMSRMRFKLRKPFMNIALILGMFPGFMSMIAVYYILKGVGLTEGAMKMVSLVLVYSGGAGLGFYIAKGFFDTIPKSIDEAASIDGATKFQIFRQITIPLSKPIIVYTLVTSFMGPWLDFIFCRVIAGADAKYYTVAVGLWNMLTKENIQQFYTRFFAGAVLVSIPISILFVATQKYYSEGLSGAVKG